MTSTTLPPHFKVFVVVCVCVCVCGCVCAAACNVYVHWGTASYSLKCVYIKVLFCSVFDLYVRMTYNR